MVPTKILVATDFSPAAELAVRRATELAQRFDAQLRLLHTVPPQRWLEGLLPTRQHWVEKVRARAAQALQQLAETIGAQNDIEISTIVTSGKATVAIEKAIEQFDPDLLVVGARGEGQLRQDRGGLGHTAAKLIGTAKTPLLLVRREPDDKSDRVLAAVDLTEAATRVLRCAQGVADKGELSVLHVFEAPFADRLRSYGVSRKTLDVYAADQQAECERALRGVMVDAGISSRTPKLVLRGDAVKIIDAQLRKLKAGTVAVGKHSRRKRDAAAPYGSVCHYLAYFSIVDVLIAP